MDLAIGGCGLAEPLRNNAHGRLVGSLRDRPVTLTIGAINGVAASTVVGFLGEERLLFALALLLGSIALLRIVNAQQLLRRPQAIPPARIELLYDVGGFAYSAVLGLLAAATVALDLPALAQALMISNAVGYGIGICARNAARPRVSLGQLALVTLPIMAAALLDGSLAGAFLAINIALLFAAMITMTYSVFRLLGNLVDSAEQSADAATRMERLALTDPVTGLRNRPGLNDSLPGFVSEAATRGVAAALFWIDLDRFKHVNELKGHQAGDAVLREIGARLIAIAGPGAIAARFAGDEFVLACHLADRSAAKRMAEAMRAELTRPVRIEAERIELGGSIGIALVPEHTTSADELMRQADLALYEAKIGGRAQIRFFNPVMTRSLARKNAIEEELRHALARDELAVHFQPMVDLKTGAIRSFEALLRWFHPVHGEIRPNEFIPVAEDCGEIVALGNWLIGEAAKTAASWPTDVTIAVNLSPLQIKAPDAARGILRTIEAVGLAPERLELEVTENLFLEDLPEIALVIAELSSAGIRFALDDFGTGYSSLAYINQWPFSKIKVDRSFVSGAQAGLKSDAIIRAVSQMGRSLDIEIVAEGLETRAQVAAVREAGCGLGQGFHFSRAVPGEEAAAMLSQGRAGKLRAQLRSAA